MRRKDEGMEGDGGRAGDKAVPVMGGRRFQHAGRQAGREGGGEAAAAAARSPGDAVSGAGRAE